MGCLASRQAHRRRGPEDLVFPGTRFGGRLRALVFRQAGFAAAAASSGR
jgi:hypothetical protein